MLPSTDDELFEELEEESYGSDTYKMNIDNESISGTASGIESVKQMIFKILNTERYEYIAYSWDFGVYTIDLYGMPYDYVCAELQRRIIEALTMDDRIETVNNFRFSKSKNKVICTFTAVTIYGDVDNEKVVEV